MNVVFVDALAETRSCYVYAAEVVLKQPGCTLGLQAHATPPSLLSFNMYNSHTQFHQFYTLSSAVLILDAQR